MAKTKEHQAVKATPVVSASVEATVEMPVGTVITYAGTTAPDGWLLCAGQSITAKDYPNLYDLIGGNVPDLRDRFLVGAGNTYQLNGIGGAASVTLSIDQMPKHQHFGFGESYSDWPLGIEGPKGKMGSHGGKDYDNYYYGTTSAGSSKAHENRPPYYALTYIIKY